MSVRDSRRLSESNEASRVGWGPRKASAVRHKSRQDLCRTPLPRDAASLRSTSIGSSGAPPPPHRSKFGMAPHPRGAPALSTDVQARSSNLCLSFRPSALGSFGAHSARTDVREVFGRRQREAGHIWHLQDSYGHMQNSCWAPPIFLWLPRTHQPSLLDGKCL